MVATRVNVRLSGILPVGRNGYQPTSESLAWTDACSDGVTKRVRNGDLQQSVEQHGGQGDPAASAAHLLAGADADRWNIAAGLGWVQGEPGLASPAVQPLQLQFLGAQIYPPAVLAPAIRR